MVEFTVQIKTKGNVSLAGKRNRDEKKCARSHTDDYLYGNLLCASEKLSHLPLGIVFELNKAFRGEVLLAALLTFCVPCLVSAQETDTAQTDDSNALKALKIGLELITSSGGDSIVNESAIAQSKPYEGKIIRNIYTRHIELEQSIYDTSRRARKIVADVADALHGTTRRGIIRNHLFMRSGDPVNPYLLADNERYLRDLDFIVDSRIIVSPIRGIKDSVDVTVITRDVFSLGGRMGGSFPSAPELSIYDANFLGRGQRLEVVNLLDSDRRPRFGYAFIYRKSSILGTFTDAELAYSQINTGLSHGNETEFSYYLRLDRPLVSPYSNMAGGLEISRNWSVNVYQKPDSLFLDYGYTIYDAWLGYNFAIKGDPQDRSRHFFAVRYFDGYYTNRPDQRTYRDVSTYNNSSGYLGEFTFYRQNYYRTRYLFGFGRTEDVPYGMNASIAAGYVRQVRIDRPYVALRGSKTIANTKGNIYGFGLEAGSFIRSGKFEDAVVTVSSSYHTRAANVGGGSRIRGLFNVGYTGLLNQTTSLPLEITENEILGFSADSLFGTRKAFFRVEATVYTPWQLFGFHFAPFAGANSAWLNCTVCEGHNLLVPGVIAGFRTRNENLIFGTMEIRLSYMPETRMTSSQFSFSFKQQLSSRGVPGFVRAPSLVQY